MYPHEISLQGSSYWRVEYLKGWFLLAAESELESFVIGVVRALAI